MKFFVIIGKENLYVYENNGSKYEQQFIEGSPCYPYDINNVEADIDTFLDSLANEKNLGTKAKLDFDVLENEDAIRTGSVLRCLDEYVSEKFNLNDTIMKVIKKLSKDKKLMIDTYGINYDGISYKMEAQKLLIGTFDLLSYTIHENDIMELL